jgi:hypothetical protein
MRRFLPILVAVSALSAGAAFAQSNTGAATGSGSTSSGQGGRNEAVNTDSTQSTSRAPAPGANSFTEGEARRRMEASGFQNVMDLKKDDQGIWRGKATKDGKQSTVSLDYRGNVVGQ